MIIVSIVGPSMRSALWQMKVSKPFADAFEFRLDMIWQPNIPLLLSSTRKVTIATCRPGYAGGQFRGREGTRIKILEKAVALGVDYVDLELEANYGKLQKFLQRVKGAKTIVSHHIHMEQFTGFEKLYSRLHGTGADVVKLAFIAWDTTANLHAFEFLRKARSDRRKAVATAMGEYGQPSRILYKKFGGWATYASSEDGSSAAPGQMPASELHHLFSAHKLNSSTKVFGVIGNPLHQSKGKYIHNEIFRRAKRNMVYCTFPVTDLSKFMRHFAPFLDGFSVTIPYKESIIGFLDELDDAAEAIGAVNTVIRRRGKLYGLNTDAPAALDAIERVCKVNGKRLLLIGAGGSARAIAYEAKRRGAEVLIANRTDRRAKTLAKELDLEHLHMAYIRVASFDILVNATPVGMVPRVAQSPAPKEILKGKVVFDAVYNPPMTKLLRSAKSVGATIVPGTEMYLNQAALQSELFTGRRPNIDLMREILLSHLSDERKRR